MASRGLLFVVLLAACVACESQSIGGDVRRGRALTDQARYQEAHAVLRAAVERADRIPAPSLDRAAAFYALGDLYLQYPLLTEPGETEVLLERAREEYAGVLGAEHPSVGLVLAPQAQVLRESGRTSEAEVLDRRARDVFRVSLPPEHPVRAGHAAGLPIPVDPDELSRVVVPEREVSDAGGDALQGSARDAGGVGPLSEEAPARVAADGTYLRPKVTLADGTPGSLHATPSDSRQLLAPRDRRSRATRDVRVWSCPGSRTLSRVRLRDGLLLGNA